MRAFCQHGEIDELKEELAAVVQTGSEATQRLLGDRERFRQLIKLMLRDHYLSQDEHGLYRFRFALIRRWWRLDLGLGPDG